MAASPILMPKLGLTMPPADRDALAAFMATAA